MSKDSHESGIQIEVCTPDYFDIQLDGLSSLLHACVNEGSSINFLLPFTTEEARDWWIGQRGNVEDGSLVLLLALAESPNNESKEVPGCVMMGLPPQPNQPHRVEVKKMLVHPKYRRRGIGRLLLERLEQEASKRDRWLLSLDTEVGSSGEGLYMSHGYIPIGQIPEYALKNDRSAFLPAVFMYKLLPKPDKHS